MTTSSTTTRRPIEQGAGQGEIGAPELGERTLGAALTEAAGAAAPAAEAASLAGEAEAGTIGEPYDW